MKPSPDPLLFGWNERFEFQRFLHQRLDRHYASMVTLEQLTGILQEDESMASSKKFKWAGHDFTEIVEHGERLVILHYGKQEFSARSEPFVREEAAAKIIAQVKEREKLVKAAGAS